MLSCSMLSRNGGGEEMGSDFENCEDQYIDIDDLNDHDYWYSMMEKEEENEGE